MGLYDSLFYSDDFKKLKAEELVIQRMLTVEAALAEAQAEEGIIPTDAAEVIVGCSNVNFIDLPRLKADVQLGGNLAIPLVKQLIRTVKNNDFEASKYVHLGATSQDIVDTGLVLGMKETSELLESLVDRLAVALVTLSRKHKTTLMIGRTLQQQAKPITFGLKSAYWLQGLMEAFDSLKGNQSTILKVQLAGAVGSGNRFVNTNVRSLVAEKLGLSSAAPWQSNRTSIATWAASLGVLAGVLGKIAKDITLLMQVEVAEVFEGVASGKGGSSTMPHKRNPVTCSAIAANAHRVPHLVASVLTGMSQEHERSAGLWHAEWETLDSIEALTTGALEKCIDLIENLEVDEERMRFNLELTNGLIYAENVSFLLSAQIGKGNAHDWVQKACKEAIATNRHLKEVVAQSEYDLGDLDALFDPKNSIGTSHELNEEILAQHEHQLQADGHPE